MKFNQMISTIDTHLAGEAFRHVIMPPLFLNQITIQEKQFKILEKYDQQKKLLLNEPRGHQGMTGTIIIPSSSSDADYGILFLTHEEEKSLNYAGLLTSLTALLETGNLVENKNNLYRVETIEGVFELQTKMEENQVVNVSIHNLLLGHMVQLYSNNSALVTNGTKSTLVFPSTKLGFPVDLNHLSDLKKWHQSVIEESMAHLPFDEAILLDDSHLSKGRIQTLTFNKSGYIYRAPRVDSTLACLAHLRNKHSQSIQCPAKIINSGLFGSSLIGEITEFQNDEQFATVSGKPFVTGFHQFILDPEDPLKDGFLIKQEHALEMDCNEKKILN